MGESPLSDPHVAPRSGAGGGLGQAAKSVKATGPHASVESDLPQGAVASTNDRRKGDIDVAGCLVWCLMRVVLVRATRAQVRDRSYEPQGSLPHYDVDEVQAEFLYKQQREDSAHTDDKVNQLLALSSSLTAAIAVFTLDVQPRWLVAVVMGLLIACVFLCLSVLEVRTANVPTLEDANSHDSNKRWARDLLVSCFANRARHAFRVDRYRAAGRYFTMALLLTPIIAFFSVSKPDPTEKITRAVERVEHAIGVQTERQQSSLVEVARTLSAPRPLDKERDAASAPSPGGGAAAAGGPSSPSKAAAPPFPARQNPEE
jgi:hypothetical protein